MAAILFVVPRFHTNLFFATKVLAEAGHRVAVFSSGLRASEDYRFVTPQEVTPETPKEDLHRMIEGLGPDLVFLRPELDDLASRVGRYCRKKRIKSVLYTLKPVIRRTSVRQLWRTWRNGLPLRRVTPVPGLTPNRMKDPFGSYLPWPTERAPDVPPRAKSPVLRVLCVAKLAQKRKNVLTLFDAAEPALAAGRVQITLVGASAVSERIPGTSQSLFKSIEARAAASGGTIKLLKDVEFSDMPALYSAHDVCVLPAFKEPLGIAPLEAMAYGCVPVISNQAGSAGYLTEGVNGHVFDPADPVALRDIVDDLAADPDKVARLGSAACNLAETELSPEVFLRRGEALLPR